MRGKYTEWVVEWTERMADRFGGIVYTTDGQRLDWGQALARLCYGLDWNSLTPDAPTSEDVQKAQQWEKGEIPSWVDQERTASRSKRQEWPKEGA